MKHNYKLLIVVLLAALVLAACGGQQASPAEDDAFKVGLLSPGSVNDDGWNSIAYNALLRIEEELGAEISYVELEQDPASFEKAFRDYASEGYDMILGHGFEFQDAAVTVSKEYPDTFFFISSSRIHDGNVVGLNTDSSQPFYLMGVIAALTAPSAGFVGGMEIPPISEALTGFEEGAKSVDPNYPVSGTFIGNFTDSAAAKEAALGMIAEGATFVVPDADVAGLGVFQAVSETGSDIGTFGAFGDFTDNAPENILGNYFADYGQGIVNIARQIQEGTFDPAGNIEFGLANEDVMWIEFNDNNPLPSEVMEAVEAAKQGIIDGSIDTLPDVD
ncbi:MAG: BMP family protein [Candidatus Promineifilaceae bacterium]|nr:BMP family protein [Candidatus Promineifilaceae bacterium]